jgi:hypothetical protein
MTSLKKKCNPRKKILIEIMSQCRAAIKAVEESLFAFSLQDG